MKKNYRLNSFAFLAVAILFHFNILGLKAQCSLIGDNNGTIYTDAQVESCLTSCMCNTINISGGNVDMDETWNLVLRGNIIINIANGATLRFNNAAQLILTAGSQINVASGGNLSAAGGTGDVKIIKGTVQYTKGNFASIVSSGGILPVTLSSFNVSNNGEANDISW